MEVNVRTKILATLSFVLMITVNVLANVLPLNGMNTGQVSDLFPNLFTPAGYTFSIWSLIYLLLLAHVLCVWGVFHVSRMALEPGLLQRIEGIFVISCLANTAWIFAWQYLVTPLSMLLIVVMLICLAKINSLLRSARLNLQEGLLIRLPFSIYFGWITVATIANACVLLVSFGFTGMPYADLWTVGVLIVGLIIALATTLRNSDAAYALTVAWAYVGILVRYLSSAGYAQSYVGVVVVLAACIVALIVLAAIAFVRRRDAARGPNAG